MNESIVNLINDARAEGQEAELSSSELAEDLRHYDRYLKGALAEPHNWLFAFGIAENINQTQDGNNLGYRFRYRLGVPAEDVIAVNPETRIRFRSEASAFGVGYVLGDDGSLDYGRGKSGSFIFIDGILHTDDIVKQVIYKRKVEPRSMEENFRQMLIYRLARFYNRTGKKDRDTEAYLKRLEMSSHKKAIAINRRKPQDSQLALIYDFLRRFYTETSVRR